MTEELENIEDYPGVVGFLSPVSIEGTVINTEGILEVQGRGKVCLSMPCDSCIAPVKVDVGFNINEKFTNAGIFDKEAESFFGECIDLYPTLRKAILLNLPMKVVCSEDCKGLCPVCGKDLNNGECGCKTDYIDPRFESLRSLFNVDKEV